MKVRSFRQNNAWIHTWAGLILGWLLYAVFLTGTLSFFQEEISEWMTPEQHGSYADEHTPLKALETLQQHAPQASQWNITLPSPRNNALSINWLNPGQAPAKGGHAGQSLELDAQTGESITPRETRGGNFLYRFHFELTGISRVWGRWIVGFATMFMLVALISGIVIHKKIFTDFFTFRPAKEQRSWLDLHCATSVLALPFHLMITYSGLVLLMFTLMPWGIQTAYEGNFQQYMADSGLRGGHFRQARSEQKGQAPEAVPLTNLQPLLEEAQARWPRGIASIQVSQPNTEKAVIEFRSLGGSSLLDRGSSEQLRFNGVTGEELPNHRPAEINATAATYNVLTSLHMLKFAGHEVRWVFFFSGILGTLMVATGLIFWSVKRLSRDPRHFGHKLVEALNVGSIVGLPIAIASYFWANRLLPVVMEGRVDSEIQWFLIAWGLCFIHPWLRSYKQAWIEQLGLASVLFVSLPLFSFGLPHSHIFSTLAHGQWVVAGMDLCLWVFGGLFGFMAWRLATRHRRLPTLASTQAPKQEATA